MGGHPVASAALPVGADAKVAVADARPGRGHLLLVLLRGVDDQVRGDERASPSTSPQQWTLHPRGVVAATVLALHT